MRWNQTISLYSFDAMETDLVRQFDRLGDEKEKMQVLGKRTKFSRMAVFFSSLLNETRIVRVF